VLADIAKTAGLDPVSVKTYLDSDEDKDVVKEEAMGTFFIFLFSFLVLSFLILGREERIYYFI
jgi:hypothetical protein